MLPVFVSRLLVILTLLAAAFPAAAGAQVPLEPPVAVTGAADSITETAANLNGTVDPNGSITTYQFEYGTTAGYGQTTPVNTASEGTDPVAVEAAIASLTRNTTYHYRLVATNAEGAISRGADRTFRSAPGPQAPTVTSTTSRDVTSRTARLLTRVDPNGQPTTVRFEYGRTTSYGAFSDRVDVGTGTTSVPVALELDRLRPNTRYHFRAVATNDTGSARSLDRSFRTPREPTGISIALNPSRVVWGQDLTVVGRINGTAVGGIRVALERQGFPFQTGFTEVATKTASSKGTFNFNVASLFETTHFRIVTRTRTPITSGIRTASSAVRVGIRSRKLGRRKSRITGAIWPIVPAGRVSLQKRSPRGRWAIAKRTAAKPLDANRSRYQFTVTKPKRKRPAARYRVVVLARDGGKHVPGRSREVRVAPQRKR